MPRDPRLRLLLAALFAVTVFFQSVYTYVAFDRLINGAHRARLPVDFGIRGPVIMGNTGEAARAGVFVQATLLEVDGRAFSGRHVLEEAVRVRRPGGFLPGTIRRADGEVVH